MAHLVHELHLLEHVGPVGAQQVLLEHHHLARGPVGHLRAERGGNVMQRRHLIISASPAT